MPLFSLAGLFIGFCFSAFLFFVAIVWYGGAGHGPDLPHLLFTVPIQLGPLVWPIACSLALSKAKQSKLILRVLLIAYWIGIFLSPLPKELFNHSMISGAGLIIFSLCIYALFNSFLLFRAFFANA